MSSSPLLYYQQRAAEEERLAAENRHLPTARSHREMAAKFAALAEFAGFRSSTEERPQVPA
ncbi:hypothetical protein [Sphingomonas xanthus]|uniref:Uncharacterized protein n=1 Tax=Sphingomonas xanthus TaxID=2594473 RepID=A0A516ITI8_9SPHN|nr:hypothetical protein [Sphingomonas xanthus]QDP20205.1 hypothetical protein FMM02_09720 [Sphingomonas xanthus]